MDLSLVPIGEIIAEIDKRFDANVLLTYRAIDGENEIYEFHQQGGHFINLGMCEQMAHCMKNQKEREDTDFFFED